MDAPCTLALSCKVASIRKLSWWKLDVLLQVESAMVTYWSELLGSVSMIKASVNTGKLRRKLLCIPSFESFKQVITASWPALVHKQTWKPFLWHSLACSLCVWLRDACLQHFQPCFPVLRSFLITLLHSAIKLRSIDFYKRVREHSPLELRAKASRCREHIQLC